MFYQYLLIVFFLQYEKIINIFSKTYSLYCTNCLFDHVLEHCQGWPVKSVHIDSQPWLFEDQLVIIQLKPWYCGGDLTSAGPGSAAGWAGWPGWPPAGSPRTPWCWAVLYWTVLYCTAGVAGPDVELPAPVLVHSREHLLHLLPAARNTVLLDTTRCLETIELHFRRVYYVIYFLREMDVRKRSCMQCITMPGGHSSSRILGSL